MKVILFVKKDKGIKMKDKHRRKAVRSTRRPLADCTLLVAITLIVVLGLRIAIFGVTVLSLVLVCMALAYIVMTVRYDSHKPFLGYASGLFLLLTILLIVVSLYLDRPTRPKRTAFQQMEQPDTFVQEQYIVETPEPVEVDSEDVVEDLDTTVILPPDSLQVTAGMSMEFPEDSSAIMD